MIQTLAVSPKRGPLPLALIPKTARFQVAGDSVKAGGASITADQRRTQNRTARSIADFPDLPGSWKHAGINE